MPAALAVDVEGDHLAAEAAGLVGGQREGDDGAVHLTEGLADRLAAGLRDRGAEFLAPALERRGDPDQEIAAGVPRHRAHRGKGRLGGADRALIVLRGAPGDLRRGLAATGARGRSRKRALRPGARRLRSRACSGQASWQPQQGLERWGPKPTRIPRSEYPPSIPGLSSPDHETHTPHHRRPGHARSPGRLPDRGPHAGGKSLGRERHPRRGGRLHPRHQCPGLDRRPGGLPAGDARWTTPTRRCPSTSSSRTSARSRTRTAPGRQLLRLDLRQVGDLAAGWGAYRLGPGPSVAMSHFVLRKTPDGWRIAHLSVARLQPGLEP